MNDPGIKMDIRPCQGDQSEKAGQSQTSKGKIGFKGDGQDSQPKTLQEKTCQDNRK
jgi:hypothetical protein